MSSPAPLVRALRAWSVRHWLVAVGTAVGTALLIGVPTDLIDTPLFTRMIPVTWWAWPALLVSSALAGLLAATYVATTPPDHEDGPAPDQVGTAEVRSGYVGGILTYFAVGCPVCNKLVLLALGSTGAVTWFQPAQPFLQAGAIGLLSWALVRRLSAQDSCPVPVTVGPGAARRS